MSEDAALKNLAEAIILQAVEDWRRLCEKILAEKVENPVLFEFYDTISFPELRQFFKSEWCALLCGNVDPLFILDALERERKAALNEI